MKNFIQFASFFFFVFISLVGYAQPGKNGAFTVTALNTVVNCYSPVTANIAVGATTASVDNSGGSCNLQCGDLVMIYQAQGATINTTNTAAYGTITNYNSAGLYEFKYVVSAIGTTITFQDPTINAYSSAGKTQLVKVPQYTNLTVNAAASIVPLTWQDQGTYRKGGLVVIHATGTVLVNGSISAAGFGFRNGTIENNTSPAGGGYQGEFVTNSSNASAEKGESIAGFATDYDGLGGRFGRGSAANGGGGGNGHNGGGGGGSNGNSGAVWNGQGIMCTGCPGTAAWLFDPFVIADGGVKTTSSGGGRGGYSYGSNNSNALTTGPVNSNWGGDWRDDNGGWGGKPLANVADSRIFFGGGGGCGDANNNPSSRTLQGGDGGGIVYIVSPAITGPGTITSSGNNSGNQAVNTFPTLPYPSLNDAPAGAGGGGSIVLKANVAATLSLVSTGGKGGDQGALGNESEGPGGGGGGGFIAVNAGAPTTTVTGGANGITLSSSLTEFIENGATSGNSGNIGAVGNTFIVFVPVNLTATVSTPVCQGSPINFTSTVNYAGGTFAWTGPGGYTSSAQNPIIASATLAQTGTFRVIYTSPGGCKDTVDLPVVVNPKPIATTVVVQPTCSNSNNGTATVNFTTNGTAPYTYLWSNSQTTNPAINLAGAVLPGTIYTGVATDAQGCTANYTATIVAPNPIILTAVRTNVACFGGATGTITPTVSGGSGLISVFKDGILQPAGVITGQTAGTYTITATDVNGCAATPVTVTITQPILLTLAIQSQTPSTCAAANGTATITVSGGNAGAHVFSSPGATVNNTTGVISGLSVGPHVITVTDVLGCSATITVVITSQVAAILSIASQSNVLCNGGNQGSVSIGATAGNGTLTYGLVGPGGPYASQTASNTFSNLVAGSYTATVTDVNGCAASIAVTITSQPQIAFTTTSIPPRCFGDCNGGIAITATGGVGGYTYNTNTGNGFQVGNPLTAIDTVGNMCVGTYNLVVSDANGCIINGTVIITGPTALSATYTQVGPLCHDGANGSITINASGGTPAYQYFNNNILQASNVLSGINTSPQAIKVRDARGCLVNTVITLVNPPDIILLLDSVNPSNCGFANGEAFISASGPNLGYVYTIAAVVDTALVLATNATGVFLGFPGSGYFVTATDVLGCVQEKYIAINDVEMSGNIVYTTDATCNGFCDGTVSIVATAGAPIILFNIFPNPTAVPTQSNGDFFNLCAGNFLVSFFDAGSCFFSIPFVINEPEIIDFDLVNTNIFCSGQNTGQIAVTNTSGGIGTYTYDIGGASTATTVYPNLLAGPYVVTVTDANLCTISKPDTIIENAPVALTATRTNLDCFNDNSGTIHAIHSGGAGNSNAINYTYSIDGGAFGPSADFFNLSAGTYTIRTRDINLCEASFVVTLTEPTPVIATTTATNTLCATSIDGTITISAIGGTIPAYQFLVDGIVGSNPRTGLSSGNHTVIVRDQNNCRDTVIQIIAAPSPVVLTATETPSTCGASNGQIQMNASGGTGAGYVFTPIAPLNLITNLAAATYNLSVVDGNNCPATLSKVVTNLASPVISSLTATSPACFGATTGQIVATSTAGGSAALSYTISGSAQTVSPFTNLGQGSYTVTVTDANLCSDAQTIVITQPSAVSIAAVSTNLTCFNNNSGSLSITPSGGTGTYTVAVTGLVTPGPLSLSALPADTYSITVTDINSCSASASSVITQPTQLATTFTTVNPNCFNDLNGAATVTPSGGTVAPGPISLAYNYDWSNNVVTSVFNNASGLGAGTYSVVITDNNNCQITQAVTIVNPAEFVVASTTHTDALCPGSCDGTIQVTAPGGVSYDFGTLGISAVANRTGICAGSYPIIVTNANGCFANTVATITQPNPITIFGAPDSLMCAGDTVPIFGFAVGGTGAFSYTWSNGPLVANQDVQPIVNTTYTVSAIDANGCPSPVHTVNLTMPGALQIVVSNDTIVCSGNAVALNVGTVAGYPDYSYQWGTNVADTFAVLNINPTTSGFYKVTVSDYCSTVTDSVFVDQFIIPTFTFTPLTNEGCNPSTFTLIPTIAPTLLGASCVWDFSDGQTYLGCDSIVATFDQPGSYDLVYTGFTADGCPLTGTFTDVIIIYANPVANFTYAPEASVVNSQLVFNNFSTSAVSNFWTFTNNGTSTQVNPILSLNNPEVGQVIDACLVVTSAQGCKDTICKPIVVQDDFTMYVPNSFTPDSDGSNNFFYPVFSPTAKVEDYRILIFNRWGEVIFESTDPKAQWNGQYAGRVVQDGTYTWKIRLLDSSGTLQRKEYIGHVSVIK
jgi:large repetitive protein